MVELNTDGLLLDAENLTELSPDSGDHQRIFLHDGSSSIPTGSGESSSEPGLYLWNHDNRVWHPAGRYSEILNGFRSEDLAKQTDFASHTSDTTNPHSVTHSQVGAYSTSDADSTFYTLSGDTLGGDLDTGGFALLDGTTTIWNSTSKHVPLSSLQADTVSVVAGTNLSGGGSIQLGNSVTIDINDGKTSGLLAEEAANADNANNLGNEAPSYYATDTALTNHTGDLQNPHSVTTSQINAVNTSELAVADGVATLDSSGLVPTGQLPSLAISETYVVADKTERLGLSAERGDIAIQQDVSKSFILKGTDPSLDSDWSELETPDSPVQSVFGRTGDVSAESGDYAHNDIANQSTDDHHTRYSDSEARTAVDGASVSITGTAGSTQTDVDNHIADTTNPHSVTNSQVGAPSKTNYDNHVADGSAHHAKYTDSEARTAVDGASVSISGTADSTQTDVDNHVADTTNPHNVTAAQTGSIVSDSDKLYVSSTEPSSPSENDIWIRTES